MSKALPTVVDPHSLVGSEMERAERLIFEACASQVAAVSLAAAHVMRAGGKRLRPLVLLLCAKACGCDEADRTARLGAAVELVHTATLVHDDVVDEADRRRGQYAVNTFFGNEASVLMGDYLVCCGLRMISDEPDPRLMRSICDVIVSMCEAEVLQITFRGDLDNTFENYLKVIRNKTARLFSFTAMAGGMLAGASQPVLESLADFGMNLGLAFQIVDDILDLTGDEQALGKPIAADLREGKFTYPILHAIGESCGEQRLYLASLLGDPSVLDEDGLDSVIEIVRGSGGFQAAYECASQYAHKASAVLLALPESPAREALFTVVSQVIERRF